MNNKITHTISRRDFLKYSGATAMATTMPVGHILANNRPIKLGYVSPRTGPLAAFAEADSFIINQFIKSSNGVVNIRGKKYPIQIVVKDSQSNPNRAAEVANELIVSDEIDMMLVSSTPETTNPVSTVCELEEIPCLSTVAPWQPYVIGRQENPTKPDTWKGFNYTYHFFWGLEDIISVFTNMWGQLDTNKSVGGLFPNDGDGNAWGDKVVGFPPVLDKLGYSITDTGRYQNLTDDFSAQITAFKNNDVEIVTGVPIPPDFTTFWTQAKQKRFKPKCASIGKALLFPQSVEALGNNGNNLSSEVWWSPTHPFTSSITNQSSAQLANAYQQSTNKQWTQPIGFAHALFEIAVDVLKRSEDIRNPDANVKAIQETNLNTIVGPINFSGKGLPPFAKNICKTPLVGGQWRLDKNNKYDLVITDNQTATNIPVASKMQIIS